MEFDIAYIAEQIIKKHNIKNSIDNDTLTSESFE